MRGELCVARAPGKGPWSAEPLHNKGPGTCGPGGHARRHSRCWWLCWKASDSLGAQPVRAKAREIFWRPPARVVVMLLCRDYILVRIQTAGTLLREAQGWGGKEWLSVWGWGVWGARGVCGEPMGSPELRPWGAAPARCWECDTAGVAPGWLDRKAALTILTHKLLP